MRFILFVAALAALAGPVAAQQAAATDPNCQAAIAFSAARKGAAVLALRDGKPVCEGYAASGAADHAMEIWSGTKSFSGLMAAAAVQDGLLTLDEPVSKTLPEWRDDPQKAKATIRQVLSLTSGLRSTVGQPPTYAAAVTTPLSTPPGETFSYGPAPFQLFGEIMSRKLKAAGQPADPYLYLKRRILDPIGLTPGQWRRLPSGDALLPQGAVLTVREWVKFGELVRAGGVWNGKPLVDGVAFAELFKGSVANPAYGVTFWLPNSSAAAGAGSTDITRSPDLPRDLVLAAGAGNQRLFIIPSQKLVVARLAEFDGRPDGAGPTWSDAAFIRFFLH
ncbi:MAG: beta-lactamase family protein [Alphaproteobacteria bacterium]|nr:beta-lactamase family protein [Alphaproteobacteria bacterium]MBU1513412.1 beta-lactamase family protein [Alphaproteobacteria bacterium]MBU2096404.1 beta-lactamase family protein [Alphaproteobacteria bacterium]MBU2149904.1 beta-lactamase family protein [Alphaproteobacteria bacterium]MBU2308190.1 beta-lactamase family protein [Alphaproteobacteria bacterium]